MKTVKRSDKILKEFVGQEFKVSTGLLYELILVTEGMEGHCFGEFKLTKILGTNIHIKKKKRKKN